MFITLDVRSRDSLIIVSEEIGAVLKQRAAVSLLIVSLGGPYKSGKSLVAMEIDKAFNPHLYRQGIHKKLSVDRIMTVEDAHKRSVVFSNFLRIKAMSLQDYDARLEKFERRNSSAQILIASNLERSPCMDFGRAAVTIWSNRLDLHIDVAEQQHGAFSRRVSLTVRDDNLGRELKVRTSALLQPA